MERKWVHFLYAAAGLSLYLLVKNTGEWAWSFFGKPKSVIVYSLSAVVAGVAVWAAWRNEQVFTLASECVTELGKVSWPTRRETMAATVVVIVTVIIASAFLGIFDGLWSYTTRLLYG